MLRIWPSFLLPCPEEVGDAEGRGGEGQHPSFQERALLSRPRFIGKKEKNRVSPSSKQPMKLGSEEQLSGRHLPGRSRAQQESIKPAPSHGGPKVPADIRDLQMPFLSGGGQRKLALTQLFLTCCHLPHLLRTSKKNQSEYLNFSCVSNKKVLHYLTP